ncbi:DinB family protein [Candidatus Acetothermia bacterium]|nr:DinB family protein [Candidatus Acetothermia bacterium]
MLDAIKGLSAEQAAWKPRKKDARSVWEIVNHVAFWKDAMARSLEKKPWLDASKHKVWPPVEEISEAAWAESVEHLKSRHRAFMRCMGKLSIENLDKPSPKEKRKLGEHIYGVLAHDCYHTGQILILRQLQGIGLE